MEQALRKGATVRGAETDAGDRLPLAVPIKVRGDVIGVLDTYKPAADGEWTIEEISLLETLAGRLGEALDSARLYQDTQRRASRERLTSEIADTMRRAADVEDIIQTAVDELFSALGTSRAFVRLGAVSPGQNGGEGSRWGDGHKR
jgi:GAF domain-containing protein